jgi:hypothetical protein
MAAWSTTTFVVSGSFLPVSMIDWRRSMRKMMSVARSLPEAESRGSLG